MVEEAAELEAMLDGTVLAGEVEVVELTRWGQTALRVDLDPDKMLEQWQVARALLPKTGRWPVAANMPPAETGNWRGLEAPMPTGVCHSSDDSALSAGEQALADMRAAIAEHWPEPPLADRLTYDLRVTHHRCGQAPSEADVLSALPGDASRFALNRWLLDWEERICPGSECPREGDHLLWFTDTGRLTFLPTPCGAESLGYLEFWGEQGVPGGSAARLIAILELWSRRWGADLVAHWGTMLQFVVSRPPQTLDHALELAEQHYVIAPATMILPGVPMREHARILVGRDTWMLHERP